MSSYDGKLVMMANQICKFYAPQKQVEPAAAIATHIRKFWDPRMRAAIIEGRIPSGERVPSTRSFAAQLGIARGTIDIAYARLTQHLLALPNIFRRRR